MACITCTLSDEWHARRAEHIERTDGPRSVLEFEQEHPEAEAEDDDDGYDIDTDPYMRGDYITFDSIDAYGNDPYEL